MAETTKALVTEQLRKSLDASEVTGAAFGPPTLEVSVDDYETTDQPIKENWRQRIGRAAYWMTHRAYRNEVRDRAEQVESEFTVENVTAKQVLPAKTRDYDTIPERRRNTNNLALDIRQYIRTVRTVRRMIGAFSLMAIDGMQIVSSEPLRAASSATDEPSIALQVVEETLPYLPGDVIGEVDYIPKIVVDQSHI